VLLDVGSTAGPGMIVSLALLMCNNHCKPTARRSGRGRVRSDSVGRSDTAGAVRSKTAANGVRLFRDY
jgi:hypothetical protein